MSGAGYHSRPFRTKSDGADDPNPNTTQPAGSDLLSLATMRKDDAPGKATKGFSAFIEFTTPGSNVCNVRIWKRDENSSDMTAPRWIDCGEIIGVYHLRGFLHDEVQDSVIYCQVLSLTGGNPLTFYAEEY